jgi:CheY-like chemotaxis protein/PAS domain-containing protein
MGIGLFCLGVLLYLCLLARVNIQHFKSSFISQLQSHLAGQARIQARHIEDSVQFIKLKLDKATSEIMNLPQVESPADSERYAQEFGFPVQIFYICDLQGRVVRHVCGTSQDDTSSASAAANLLKTVKEGQTGALRPDASDDSRLWILSKVQTPGGFAGYAVIAMLREDLMHSFQCAGMIRQNQFLLMDSQRQASIVPVESSISEVLKKAAGGKGAARLLSNSSRASEPVQNNLVIGYCPAVLFNESWPVSVISDDSLIEASVRTHAEGIFVAMICLFLVLLIICGFYYRSEKRRLILEQQTELSQTTSELQLVAGEKRQLCEQFNKDISFLRQILQALPVGLYWKNEKGELQGQNTVLKSWLKEAKDSKVCFELIDDHKLDQEVLTKGIDLMHVPQTLTLRGHEKKVLISRIPLRGPGAQITGMLNCQIPVDSFKNLSSGMLCEYFNHGCAADLWALPTVLTDASGSIRYANPAFTRWLGRSGEQFRSAKLYEVLELPESAVAEPLKTGGSAGTWVSLCVRKKDVDAFIQKSAGPEANTVLLVFADTPAAEEVKAPQHAEQKAALPTRQNPDSQTPTVCREQTAVEEKAAEVLVVDDVEENRTLLEILVTKNACRVTSCSNGRQAVERCGQSRYDLILMDIQMPDMDGFEAMQRIRQSELNRSTPMIAMTASDKREDELAALECGFDDYLSKPINRKLMEQKIWRSLQKVKQVSDTQAGKDIISFLDGNPDYRKAIETFVQNLPARLEEMRQAFESRDLKSLAFKVHALKGIGGFAGFSVYTDKAKTMEEALKEEQLDKVQEQLDELVRMCLRTRLKSDCS